MKNVDLLVLGHTAFDYIMQVREFSKINTTAIKENMETLQLLIKEQHKMQPLLLLQLKWD